MGLSKIREKWAGASNLQNLQNQINNVTNQQIQQAQTTAGSQYNPYTITTGGTGGSSGAILSVYPPVTPMPYPNSSTEMVLSLITLMYTVGPDLAKRLIKKFELTVDNDIVNKIADGIKELNSDSNDLDKVINECAEELKI
jgi:hypothetical protein